MRDSLLSLSQVCLSYHQRQVLKDINLTVNPGEIVTLVGPNGAGKTSLSKIALGLVKPDSGSVMRRKGLVTGYMPQRLRIDDSLPLNVDRFLWLSARTTRNQRKRALAQVQAEHLFKQAVQQLSGGEMQRVMLARALLRKPQLLVLDEPAQGVDVAGQSVLYGILGQVRNATGCAILLVSHDLHWVMASTDRVVCLQGHICCEGSPEHIQQAPAFTELFGEPASSIRHLAPYSHHHDHHHDLQGNCQPSGDSLA